MQRWRLYVPTPGLFRLPRGPQASVVGFSPQGPHPPCRRRGQGLSRLLRHDAQRALHLPKRARSHERSHPRHLLLLCPLLRFFRLRTDLLLRRSLLSVEALRGRTPLQRRPIADPYHLRSDPARLQKKRNSLRPSWGLRPPSCGVLQAAQRRLSAIKRTKRSSRNPPL